MNRFARFSLLFAAECLCVTRAALAGPQVDVVIGADAPKLERFAADELAGQFKKLFDADVRIGAKVPASSTHLILLGSPATNPAVKALGDVWPKLTDQGHVLRSVKSAKGQTLLCGGGSPVATLWAVYELGHHFGIRYMLFGDLLPVTTPELTLVGLDLVLEPSLRSRAWRAVGECAIGSESWGLEEQQLVLRQVAKLKFNRVVVEVHAWQPFVDFEFKGIRKQTALLFHGKQFKTDGDTAGRTAFRGARVFDNPDFVGKEKYVDRIAAGVRLVGGVLDTAQQLGMTAGLAFCPVVFPQEFKQEFKTEKFRYLSRLSIGPGPQQLPDDSLLLDLAKTQIRASLATYPQIDALYLLTEPSAERDAWVEPYQEAWNRINSRTAIGKVADLQRLTEAAGERHQLGNSGVRLLRSNLVVLDFLHMLLSDRELLRSPAGHVVKPVVVDVDPSLYCVLDKVVPPNIGVLHYVDVTTRRVERDRHLLTQVAAKTIPSSLILTLSDDTIGFLPQMAHSSLHTLVNELRTLEWEGFSTRYWNVGDIDFSTFYVSRASFDGSITPAQACEDLLTTVGGEGVAERVFKAFGMIEQATVLVDENGRDLGCPDDDVMRRPAASTEPPPAWWGKVRELYLNAMNEMYRANTRAREGGRPFTLYFARRFEFAYEYMNCVEATRKAGIAKSKGDTQTQIAELEKAVEAIHAACDAMAAVARSNSDRGIIAVLNEYAYRPLKRELEAAEKAAGGK